MTVIMVLMTFAIFLLIDYVRGQKQTAKQPVLVHAIREVAPRVVPAMVAGFQVPENVRYHAGHTWALSESSELVRVGMDDFASKLIGKIESIALPQRGRWVRQGQKIWTIFRDGKSVDMVSPIEGTITDVNEAVVKNPELARRDPYGEGWLVTVQAPDSKLNSAHCDARVHPRGAREVRKSAAISWTSRNLLTRNPRNSGANNRSDSPMAS